MTGRLVVVGTPIGNLEDISPRAVRSLAEADAILCEDTRRTRKLLSALAIPAPRLMRLDRHTEAAQVEPVVAMIREGATVALVSDAGMPTVCDPGDVLVKEVAAAGLATEVVPGPCAVSAALALSGFPASQYRFVGFLPRKGRARRDALEAIRDESAPIVIYEAPHRVGATLADLGAACGPEREVAATRELTKLHEEVWRTTLGQALPRFGEGDGPAKGEWVLVIGPRPSRSEAPAGPERIAAALQVKLDAGADRRQAVREVAAELGLPKRVVYETAVTLKGAG